MSGDELENSELENISTLLDSRMMYTDNDGKSYDIEGMIDALDHIMRVSRQANTITTRLKMIELRAKSALEGTDEWKDYDYPTNRAGQRENLRKRFREAKRLLELSECPNNCSDGQYLVANDDWEQCQWCAERKAVLE